MDGMALDTRFRMLLWRSRIRPVDGVQAFRTCASDSGCAEHFLQVVFPELPTLMRFRTVRTGRRLLRALKVNL